MTVDELLSADPTDSEYISQRLIVELFEKEDWRCYSSQHYWGTEKLVDRFLRSHARIKGLVSDEIYAALPAAILHTESEDGSVVRVGLFNNGAVLVAKTPEYGQNVSLFVDDKTATMWGYPDDFVYLPQLK